MSFANVQKLLARVLTEEELRLRFFEDPQEIGQQFDLTHAESTQLLQLSKQQLEFIAISLIHKRMGQVQKQLPLTYQFLKDSFHQIFHDFAKTYVPKGVRKHQEDAATFVHYLQQHVPAQSPPWLGELALYELRALSFLRSTQRMQLHLYRFPIPEIALALHQKQTPTTLSKRTLVFWHRWGKRPRHHAASIPSFHSITKPKSLPQKTSSSKIL